MDYTDVLLIYPRLGSQDTVLRDIPLSLIYAATDSVKNGYNVKIIDCRLYPDTWKDELNKYLKKGCSLVGLSVMTGYPITTSLEISRYIKESFNIPIVWGGPHPTILPEQTLQNQYIDFVIRDWGSKPLYQLISHIRHNHIKIDEIAGLCFKEGARVILNKDVCDFEILNYQDIPYQLVDIDSKKYNRLYGDTFYFPIYTAMGCPYQCAFCMSPKVYEKIKGKKWIPFSVESVLDHIQYLLERYSFQRLQIYDDDSFVDLDRMKNFFEKYIARGFNQKVKLDFRGIRINELDRLDDTFLRLMVAANVEILAIGAESGSDNILKQMNKGITVEQTLRVSKKLSNHPSLIPHYNILCGVPGESYDDLLKTKSLMENLTKDNPSALIGAAGDWKPYPGSVMTERAVRDYGLKLPNSLEEWAQIDSLDAKKIVHPWYTEKSNNYIKLLQLAGQLLDKKLEMLEREVGKRKLYLLRFFILMAKAYRPILKFRLKYNLAVFLIEYDVRTFLMRLMGRMDND